MAVPRIFVSMGTPYAPKYEIFREALERFLRDDCNTDPRILEVNEYPIGDPLGKIRDVMKTCDGVVIVAYERKFVGNGAEKRTATKPISLDQRTYTTPWNHIETALAYSLDLPIYVLCEEGLTEDGLIETKVDWYVQRIDFMPERLREHKVSQSIRTWVDQRVRPRSGKLRPFKALEGTLKFSEMTPKEIWSVGAFIIGVFFTGAAVGHWFSGFSIKL